MENQFKLNCRVYKTFNSPAGSAFWVDDVIVVIVDVVIVAAVVVEERQ